MTRIEIALLFNKLGPFPPKLRNTSVDLFLMILLKNLDHVLAKTPLVARED